MKELSIEEKAKRYDKAIERAKEWYNNPNSSNIGKSYLYAVFPELKEREDMQIMKEIAEFIYNSAFKRKDIKKKEKWLAWLEKQGKRNSTNKIEPEFHEGDWTVSNLDGKARQISEVHFDEYNSYYVVDGKSVNLEEYDRLHHLWTIQDAKDGDVLACESGWTCIFKTLVNDETFSSYCFMDKTKWFCEKGSECHTLKEEFVEAYNGKIYPATKEQRDILLKVMADAGYTFDFEKKELKKIEDEPKNYKHQVMSEMTDLVKDYIKQKPAEWSEEDKTIITNIIIMLKEGASLHFNKKDIAKSVDWLNSLKDRVQPKKKWKQENTGDLTDFEGAMMHIGGSFFGENAGLDPNDTNVIKEQANLLLELVPKQEWSEEDQNINQSIIDILTRQGFQTQVNWLKSLKKRIIN